MEEKYIGVKPYDEEGKNGNLGSIFTRTVCKDGRVIYICPKHLFAPYEEQLQVDIDKGYLIPYNG